jgi:hypothetical protein
MAQPPGRLIGAGRTADVYALGRGRVLRRYRGDSDVAAEAAATSEVDGLPGWLRPAARTLRGAMVREFLAAVGHDPAPVLAAAARARMADASVRPAEAEHLRRVAEEAGEGGEARGAGEGGKARDPGGPG